MPRRTSARGRYLPVDPQTLGRLRILRVGDVELQLDGHRLLVRGTPVHLPHKEFVILRQLMDNAGRVVTRCELLDNAWGPDRADARNYLEVHIRRLRVKLTSGPVPSPAIVAVRGFGYKMAFEDAASGANGAAGSGAASIPPNSWFEGTPLTSICPAANSASSSLRRLGAGSVERRRGVESGLRRSSRICAVRPRIPCLSSK